MIEQNGGDFTRFDAEAADLDLLIGAARNSICAIGSPASEIARSIQTLRRFRENGSATKRSAGQIGRVHVTARQTGACRDTVLP